MTGWSIISDTWELGAFGHDGEGVGTSARAYDSEGKVSFLCEDYGKETVPSVGKDGTYIKVVEHC